MKIKGSHAELTLHGGEAKVRFRLGGKRGARDAARHLLAASRSQVPIETGDLYRSGEVVETDDGAAAGFDIVYAARQHEETTWKHPNGGKAKYLEDPAVEEADVLLALLARGIRRDLR